MDEERIKALLKKFEPFKVNHLCEIMGISYNRYWRLIHLKSDFYIPEIQALISNEVLTPEEAFQIFLAV